MPSTKFTQRNRGTATCEYCGKVTWKERIECGLCERCNILALNYNSYQDGDSEMSYERFTGIMTKNANKSGFPALEIERLKRDYPMIPRRQ
jgi:hypothetical protein